jgi:hypothetical protein
MNNPFANFDLEESLSGLPEGLRQPMVLAVIASGLVHGFTFLLLPVLTTSVEAKQQGTERVVSVLELTPEEQARLPVSMTAVNPVLPGAIGKLPLTSLLPGTNTPTIKINPNPVNDFFSKANTGSTSTGGGFGLGTYSYGNLSNPIITGGSTNDLDSAERKRLRELEKAENDRQKAAEEAAKKAKEEPAKVNQDPVDKDKNNDPANQTKVEPGNQNNSPMPPQPQTGSASSPTQPQPVTPTPELIAATQYGLPAGAEKPEYIDQQSQQLRGSIIAASMPEELRTLPSDDPKRRDWETANQEQIGQKALYLASSLQPQEFQPRPAPLPPGITEFKFNGVPAQTRVSAVIEVYATPEGKLMAQPTVIRSSGFKYLDDLALKEITDAVNKAPLKNPVRYTIPFDLPAAKPTA